MNRIGIILGSDSDLPRIKGCFDILEHFSIDFEIIISSAHRSPEQTQTWVKEAESKEIGVIIAAAGGAAHLPGVVASHTILPVIGIPIETALSGGLDSLLSISQMPSGIPVATMAAGKAGGTNAALFAVQILAASDTSLKKRLHEYRENMKNLIIKKNATLTKEGYRKYIDSLEKSKENIK